MGQIDFYQQVDGQPDVLGVVEACRQKYKILWDIKINELFIGSLNGIQLSNTATENTFALLRANLTGTDFMETDVGQHGCNIWTSRCHAISSTIYASAMTSNGFSYSFIRVCISRYSRYTLCEWEKTFIFFNSFAWISNMLIYHKH